MRRLNQSFRKCRSRTRHELARLVRRVHGGGAGRDGVAYVSNNLDFALVNVLM
ncbi:MAG TPA: hypothetical protein VE135_14850 [Pyrinomonadaceae bacterium]|nr:hypothetical protein [Pyrinomonadaceae bacterium]